jgi:hypothetical protein
VEWLKLKQVAETLEAPTSQMIREAQQEDVPAVNHRRLKVRENIPSDPARVTAEMAEDAISVAGRGWRETGRLANGDCGSNCSQNLGQFGSAVTILTMTFVASPP